MTDLEDGFRMGLEAAALYFDGRARGLGERLAHMEATIDQIPGDLQYRLTEDLRDAKAQATLDAHAIRLLPMPEDVPTAMRGAEDSRREQYRKDTDDLRGQRNRSQDREQALRAENEKWKDVKDEIIARIRKQDQFDPDDPARGELLSEVRTILEAL